MAASDLTLKSALGTVPAGQRLMGLDLGSKTIGVATSDRTRTIATPIETIERTKFTADANRLVAIAAAENIGLILLGLPVNMDSTEGPRCQSTRAFARNFAKLSPLPVRLVALPPLMMRSAIAKPTTFSLKVTVTGIDARFVVAPAVEANNGTGPRLSMT